MPSLCLASIREARVGPPAPPPLPPPGGSSRQPAGMACVQQARCLGEAQQSSAHGGCTGRGFQREKKEDEVRARPLCIPRELGSILRGMMEPNHWDAQKTRAGARLQPVGHLVVVRDAKQAEGSPLQRLGGGATRERCQCIARPARHITHKQLPYALAPAPAPAPASLLAAAVGACAAAGAARQWGAPVVAIAARRVRESKRGAREQARSLGARVMSIVLHARSRNPAIAHAHTRRLRVYTRARVYPGSMDGRGCCRGLWLLSPFSLVRTDEFTAEASSKPAERPQPPIIEV